MEIFWDFLVPLFGGLGLFLYGMNVMSEGLETAAGDSMKRIVEKLTTNRILAVIVGAIVTVLVQSSSATTVMVVGFVNAGVMNLVQAVGVIMGANIGTTITAQLVAFKLTDIAPIAIALGVVLRMTAKKSQTKNIANVLIGFGILFLGMGTMSAAMKPLRSNQGFVDLLQSFGQGTPLSIFLGVLAGFGVTAVVQSSSATTAILVTMAAAGLLDLQSAMPMLFGANIGTCVTAMLSSIGANKTAKRAALVHLLFNVIGALVFLIFLLQPTTWIVEWLGGEPERQLANAHTVFNIANTLLMIPFAGVLVKVVQIMIPITEDEAEEDSHGIKYLDERILQTPSIAVVQVIKEVLHMGNITRRALEASHKAIINNDMNQAKKVFKYEKTINEMEHKIGDYLVKLSNSNISDDQRNIIDGLFSTINDIERVGDHADNMAELAVTKIEGKIVFSEKAQEEFIQMSDKVLESFKKSLSSMKHDDTHIAKAVIEIEGEVDEMEKSLRRRHIRRLNENRCNTQAGIIFLDLISNLERVSDHASNVAIAVIDK